MSIRERYQRRVRGKSQIRMEVEAFIISDSDDDGPPPQAAPPAKRAKLGADEREAARQRKAEEKLEKQRAKELEKARKQQEKEQEKARKLVEKEKNKKEKAEAKKSEQLARKEQAGQSRREKGSHALQELLIQIDKHLLEQHGGGDILAALQSRQEASAAPFTYCALEEGFRVKIGELPVSCSVLFFRDAE
eukprot:TRINITY_DN7561_c0_g1_i1.p2 TRINITY_DN7561_c0_g1~~TRINITY_DN7561_c0_g1_i1.p2  ORF type:complete len:191 (+),score=76.06 TRINITY_DN7561_c0_g1_i1:115-687(+)